MSPTPPPVPTIPPPGPPSSPAPTEGSIVAPTPSAPPAPTPEATPPTTPAPLTPVSCPWTFQLKVVEGRTQLTARSGDEVQLQVLCDRLDMQAPNGAIQAAGTIAVTSPGLEATSERLTINLREDRVVLDGHAQLRARREGQELEMQADHLSLRIVGGRLSGDCAVAPAQVKP
jgi:hypothetical protein